MRIRTYSELVSFDSFEERYKYLKLDGVVGNETFGHERLINQMFYSSKEWKAIRDFVIFRDNGCDLAVSGYDIHGKIYIHHMNPISIADILARSDFLLNPEYLISTTFTTHNGIHYGDLNQAINSLAERKPNDTCPWKY